jgi:hypothetical protein
VASAINLWDLRVGQDTNLLAGERFERMLKLLQSEVAAPTQPHEGYGGKIDHDYTMAQIIKGIYHIAKDAPEIQKSIGDSTAFAPPDIETSEALQIVLAQCGNSQYRDKMLNLITSDRGRFVRMEAADALRALYSAKWPNDLIAMLPDQKMKDALHEIYKGYYGINDTQQGGGGYGSPAAGSPSPHR